MTVSKKYSLLLKIIKIIIIIAIIVFLYLFISKYINPNEQFNNIDNKKTIPKVIYMCHKNINDIKKYSENWTKLNPDYEIKLYDNELCEKFLLEELSELHYNIFKFIPDGPIKADFWRVCIIFKKGGIYADADIKPIIPLKDYIENNVDFVTCISNNFNASSENFQFNPHFIMAHAGDTILQECINRYINYYNNNIEYKYWTWSICNLFIIKNIKQKKSGIHYDENGKKYQFLLERPDLETCEYNGTIVLNNRYDNYKDHKFVNSNN